MGFDSAWTAEAWSTDAVTQASWLAARTSRISIGTAIMQLHARTPAMTAMTAMSLQDMSGGRFILGVGPSGPQVVEGWHGLPYGNPLKRMREYIAIIRQIHARDDVLRFQGDYYQIPNYGPGTTGLGKPLKSSLELAHGLPIYSASFTPAGLRTSAEIADGILPIFMDPERYDLFADHLETGFSRATDAEKRSRFEIAPLCQVAIHDDLKSAYDSLRPFFALYIGGMGAREKNFYNDYACSLGFGDMARDVQDLYLAGQRSQAAARIEDRFIDTVALVGPPERIRERLQAWQAAARRGHVSTLIIAHPNVESLRLLAETVL